MTTYSPTRVAHHPFVLDNLANHCEVLLVISNITLSWAIEHRIGRLGGGERRERHDLAVDRVSIGPRSYPFIVSFSPSWLCHEKVGSHTIFPLAFLMINFAFASWNYRLIPNENIKWLFLIESTSFLLM